MELGGYANRLGHGRGIQFILHAMKQIFIPSDCNPVFGNTSESLQVTRFHIICLMKDLALWELMVLKLKKFMKNIQV